MRLDPLAANSILLLPERRRLGGDPPSDLARLMARAETFDVRAGEQAQLQRCFDVSPQGWPVAAVQRQAAAGDAGAFGWMRADPVHVRAEMTGARLLAWDTLGLSDEDADALVASLAETFGEHGIDIGRTSAGHWYLRMPPECLPAAASVAPGDALGEDLFGHLPAGESGRTWRRLQSEAQILLAQHPVNAARAARGLPTANSVWFWGEGVLPDSVRACFGSAAVATRDPQLAAFAQAAGRRVLPEDDGAAAVVDLRAARHWAPVEAALAARMPAALAPGLVLDFADAPRLRCRAPSWWRRWA